MSRDKFEEFLKQNGDALFWNTSDAMFKAWIAGRESMRDEAAVLCEGRAVIHYDYLSDECTSPQEISDLESHECAAAIREIEL